MVKDPASDPKGLIAANMKEDMMNILAPMQNYRSEESTSMSVNKENERNKIAAEERKASRTNNKNNNSGTFDNFAGAIDWAKDVWAGADASDSVNKPIAPQEFNLSKINQINGVATSRIKGNKIQLFDKDAKLLKEIDFNDTKEGIKTLAGYAQEAGLSIGVDSDLSEYDFSLTTPSKLN
jgi:flagellum-specific peptidoglycan hydrolase FlgJ